LQALASSLLLKLSSLGGGDASLAALQRDLATQPFVLARLTELLDSVVSVDREACFKTLSAELAQKEHMLHALRAEYQAISKAAALKESLLHERAEILKEELLSTKAAESSTV
jgi:hypothetical protein